MTQLNNAQQTAVDHEGGPMLVVAGAGTGKTRVIVERIVRLINAGVPKQSILALTFTEKASQEMLDRVSEALQQGYGVELNIFTFNGFGQEMLRQFASEIGLSNSLKLVGDSGKVVLLREHLDELELDYFSPISTPDAQLANLSNYFSKLKQQLVTPELYLKYAEKLPATDEAETAEKRRHQELARAFSAYVHITSSRNIIDYDDQLYLLVQLLEQRPNILKRLQDRFQYILVDEFQDTNPMQSRVLDLLAQDHKNIMVVGDDDQSIYGWRGATLANILEFKQRYPQTKEVALIENFRSTQEILDAAYRLIQTNNPYRLEVIEGLDKQLRAHRGNGKKPSLQMFATRDAELDWVAHDIKQRISRGTNPGSIAVLARRNDGVRRMHEVLEAESIPHTMSGVSNDMYRQPIVSVMIEALKTIADPNDSQALYHTLTGQLFKLDAATIGSYFATARKTHQPLFESLENSDDEKLNDVLKMIHSWREKMHIHSVGSLAYMVLDESGVKDELYTQAQNDNEIAYALQVLGKWFTTLRDFSAVVDIASTQVYLDSLPALRAEGETVGDDINDIPKDMPVVMSVHKAKGLEWEIVYIIDCTEQTFPLKRFGSSLEIPAELSNASEADDHYNEERRLMYVAVTRARDELILTYSETHNGTTKRKPSRFLEELFGTLDETTHHPEDSQTHLELFRNDIPTTTKLSLPSSMTSGNNLVLSASQISDYLRCPLDFKYTHILGVPPAPDPARHIGTLLHSLIQQINEALLAQKSPPDLKLLQEQLDLQWPLEGFPSAFQRDRALKASKSAFSQFYENALKRGRPIACEESFSVHIPDSRLVMNGRIDVIFPHKDGVEICDYKTSTSADSDEKAKKSAQTSKQLEMYALAWFLKHGEFPSVLSLDFVQTGHIGTVKKQVKTITNLQLKLTSVAQDILDLKFEPGYDHRFCRHPL